MQFVGCERYVYLLAYCLTTMQKQGGCCVNIPSVRDDMVACNGVGLFLSPKPPLFSHYRQLDIPIHASSALMYSYTIGYRASTQLN